MTAFDFVTNFSESSISAYAGQAAFFLMLSFFPFLLFFFSLLSWTPLTEADFLMWASSFIPESFGDIMKDLASVCQRHRQAFYHDDYSRVLKLKGFYFVSAWA